MSKPISEQNEWIRNELKNYFSEDEADYFVNPSRNISTSKGELSQPAKAASAASMQHAANAKRTRALAQHAHTTGLYAQKIWEGLRDESGDRLKPFDLDKELQVSFQPANEKHSQTDIRGRRRVNDY